MSYLDTTAQTLQVTSLFLSIDGEINSFGQGTPSFFIRLAGCNLRCWQGAGGCDTTYAFADGTAMSVEEILAAVDSVGCSKVTITGGEPLLQHGPAFIALLQGLYQRNIRVSMETNGTFPPDFEGRACIQSLIYDIKCPSTGCTSRMVDFTGLHTALGRHDFIKFVIRTPEDYDFARELTLQARHLQGEDSPTLAFSPFLGPQPDVLTPDALVARILADKLFEVRLNLQIHKFIWPNATKDI